MKWLPHPLRKSSKKVVERIVRNEDRQRLPDRRKGYTQKLLLAQTRFICEQANMKMGVWVKFSSTCIKKVLLSVH